MAYQQQVEEIPGWARDWWAEMDGEEEVACLCADLCTHREQAQVLDALKAGASRQAGKPLAWRGGGGARVFVRSASFLPQLPPPLQDIFAPWCSLSAASEPAQEKPPFGQALAELGGEWRECRECRALDGNMAAAEHEHLRAQLLHPAPSAAARHFASAYEVGVEASQVLLGRVHVRVAQCHLGQAPLRPPKGISHYHTVVRIRVGTSLTRSWPMPHHKLVVHPRLQLPRERFPDEEQAECWQLLPPVRLCVPLCAAVCRCVRLLWCVPLCLLTRSHAYTHTRIQAGAGGRRWAARLGAS